MRTRLLAFVAASTVALGTIPAATPETFPIPPRVVKIDMAHSTLGKVAPAVAKAAGLPFTFPSESALQPCEAPFGSGRPFWQALEFLADQTGNRISLGDGGRKIALVPRGKSQEVSSISGPFRVVAERVTARYLLEEGVTVYEVLLNIHWEPRFPVFRIDAEPTVTKATDDRGTALTSLGGKAKTHPTAAASHAATIRLGGLTRASRKISTLEGHFTVTASAKMVPFQFPDLAAKGPKLPAQEGIASVLKRFEKDGNVWEAELEFTYPPKLPVFESFESWTTANRVWLAGPDGKMFFPTDHAASTAGSRMSATYYFKEDPAKGLVGPAGKGWALVCEVPSAPIEFAVPFELKEVPLP